MTKSQACQRRKEKEREKGTFRGGRESEEINSLKESKEKGAVVKKQAQE